ncbi:uncharacterized protein LOC129619299 [Condylostylus longicornis]|uniref:uncharacterized protein LOC129619299 n=1 Tax=Condylostylus longicornis TaxID=2530218 RepID=UPI00244E380A|nr:uncharacterized protein LOC129619299 [Condylostylus longicornis]
MNLIQLWIIAIAAGVFCSIQSSAQKNNINENFEENFQNLKKLISENDENIELYKNLRNIRKRSLLKINNEFGISENENLNINDGDYQKQNDVNLENHNSSNEIQMNIGKFNGNILSPGYPKPYSLPSFENYTISLDPTLDLKLVFYLLDTRYQKDYINITLEYFDDKQNIVFENSSTLLLSGTFEQNLNFYARNYHRLKIEFRTSRKFSKYQNSKGFFLNYNILKMNLSNVDGLLLPGTTTIFTSKLVSIPKNLSPQLIVSDENIKNLKISFCEAINAIKYDNETSKCDIDLVKQDIIVGLTAINSNSSESDGLQTSMQIICSTTMDYMRNAKMEIIYRNPYETVLMWLAVFFGSAVGLAVIIVAIIRSNICGFRKSKINNNLTEINNHNNIIPTIAINGSRDVERNGHIIEKPYDTCNKAAFQGQNELQEGTSGTCTCRIQLSEDEKEKF